MKITEFQKVSAVSEAVDDVFTLSDLRVLYSVDSEATLYRKIRGLIEAKALVKVKRGVYARPYADLRKISQRIEPESYISTGTVLADAGLIGTIPARRVQAVKVGRSRIYRCPLGTIEHLGVGAGLFFGFDLREGLRIADSEKAYLDAWYFTYKGRSFSFDPVEDVDREALDARRVEEYLSGFDLKFRSFFNRYWRSACRNGNAC